LSPVRHLNNAPVKEAIIDCQFIGNWNRDLSEVCAELAGSQGRVSDLFETSVTFTVNNEEGEARVDPSANNSRVGKRIDFTETHQVLQIQRTGFTFSQLEPYGSWLQVVDDARRMWEKVKANISDLHVARLAVRYINVIDLPIPFDDFNEYLTAAPQIPAGLPQGLSQFLIRTVSPIESDLVVVTQSLNPGEGHADRARVVLDIDVSCIDTDHLTDVALSQTLDRLRDRKNAVFFSYLTEKALEMYK
jgi:uncharacterized protein (TIGR04255 family)